MTTTCYTNDAQTGSFVDSRSRGSQAMCVCVFWRSDFGGKAKGYRTLAGFSKMTYPAFNLLVLICCYF